MSRTASLQSIRPPLESTRTAGEVHWQCKGGGSVFVSLDGCAPHQRGSGLSSTHHTEQWPLGMWNPLLGSASLSIISSVSQERKRWRWVAGENQPAVFFCFLRSVPCWSGEALSFIPTWDVSSREGELFALTSQLPELSKPPCFLLVLCLGY